MQWFWGVYVARLEGELGDGVSRHLTGRKEGAQAENTVGLVCLGGGRLSSNPGSTLLGVHIRFPSWGPVAIYADMDQDYLPRRL
jgi:hypothetical protein